jgi:hypothetical protein
VNKAPQSGRLIRPRLAGFEVTGDSHNVADQGWGRGRPHNGGAPKTMRGRAVPPQGFPSLEAPAARKALKGGDLVKSTLVRLDVPASRQAQNCTQFDTPWVM